ATARADRRCARRRSTAFHRRRRAAAGSSRGRRRSPGSPSAPTTRRARRRTTRRGAMATGDAFVRCIIVSLFTTRLTWITRVCCLALVVAITWPLPARRLFPMNDVLGFHVPVRTLYQQMLAHGDPPMWTPALFAGFDLHGEGQIGAYHPLHQVL